MGNVVAANFRAQASWTNQAGSANSASDARQILWKLSRSLKAAGWIYKASGNTNAKDTTGAYSADLWGGYGLPISGQSGNTAGISTMSGNIATVVGLTGMTTNSVGRVLNLRGSITSATNNGYFRILSFISATSVTALVVGGVADTNNKLFWQELDSTYVTGSGSTANITTFTGNRVVTVTGLSGMTPLSANRWLTISGAASGGNNGTFKILKYISSSSVTIINTSGVAPDGNNGAISWRELDPLQEQYVPLYGEATGSGPWICMQGPSTLRMRFTTQSTGTFIRGETITQTTTGAQGEVLGYQYDSVASDGYLIIMPQVNGNGAGVQGWDGVDAITGDLSGATLTPANSPQEFVREIVFWLNNITPNSNMAYIQCVDSVGENSSRFSTTLAASAGCTATIAPGGGGTGNAFPTVGSYVFMGATPATGSQWSFITQANTSGFNNIQIMCADATYDGYRSADGSWICAAGFTSSVNSIQATGSHLGYIYTRVDNQEDGDVDPYVMYCPQQTTFATTTATNNTSFYSGIGEGFNAASVPQTGGSSGWNGTDHLFSGWRRRGMLTNDAFQSFAGAELCMLFSSAGTVNGASSGALIQGPSDEQKTANLGNHMVLEPFWVVSIVNLLKMRKGTPRWIRLTCGGKSLQLYNGGTWVQLSNSYPAFVCGPWDGVSTPEH